jgi:hypothetical protein
MQLRGAACKAGERGGAVAGGVGVMARVFKGAVWFGGP